jgi:preprotein translocase subunit SecE
MASSSTREGSAAMAGEANEQAVSKSPNWLTGIRQFWHEVVLEMKKVSWPARNEVVNTTLIVVIAIFFFAFYLFLIDIVFTYLIAGIEWVASKVLG